MLVATLGASFLGNMLAATEIIRAGVETNRTREDFSCRLIL